MQLESKKGSAENTIVEHGCWRQGIQFSLARGAKDFQKVSGKFTKWIV